MAEPLPMAWKPTSSYRPIKPCGSMSTMNGVSPAYPATSTYVAGVDPPCFSPGTSAMKLS